MSGLLQGPRGGVLCVGGWAHQVVPHVCVGWAHEVVPRVCVGQGAFPTQPLGAGTMFSDIIHSFLSLTRSV